MWRLLLLGRGRCAPNPARPACAPGLGGGRGHSPERGTPNPCELQGGASSSQCKGIESMRAGHCRAAFTCFKLAADRGYSKAQFNVGLCYEHGRGTEKDLEKAGFYYCQAASSHHPMAQYRYARFLLQHGPGSCWDRRHKAVALLERAAGAGITEAQAYLGVFYMRGLQPQEKRGLKYLLQAANSGDAQSRYHVGVCYEQGLGVQQDVAEALRQYRQSAAAGNAQARQRLRAWQQEPPGGILKYLEFENKPCDISYTTKSSTFHTEMLLQHLHFCIRAKLWLPLDPCYKPPYGDIGN
ncbi:hypothetical protein DUI87_30576 [Hirundo rustica rustica]|uniref:Death ligand signal enhancer n=1 Tax=Hirundo rustica rustica TaxID=333673 RepID=A0A3M0IYM1_HIRRU|nr:hypothetical protein DUI87_30576 [Hirundo rustica rustica]